MLRYSWIEFSSAVLSKKGLSVSSFNSLRIQVDREWNQVTEEAADPLAYSAAFVSRELLHLSALCSIFAL